ncbi:hypothetical protein AWC38_SpisGene24814 [Stylophora pistillata]|uniref:Uncharacterized protein n=1 Tax=Stylophora pistillata TaxID=50429 RepID=A0A2B4R1C0_STYPI|nr:hypothetical protein AWC38_SpisGene24814 [Stylophora pistillata]
MIIQRKIDALETVDKQLDFLMEVKYMTDVVNRIAILFNIAKIIEKDKEQKKVLKQEKSKAYIELLDSILEKLHRCLPQNLAVLMWSLGMNGEKHKKLLQLCEKKILSCGMSVFNNENIFQILNGCANLNMTKSPIFPKFEQAFLNGDVKISDLADHHLSGILYSFAIAGNGSVELFEALLEEFLSRDMTSMNSHPIAEFVWSFAKKEQEADELFDKVEAEVISRDMMDLNKTDFVKILWAFGKAEKGSKEFFQSLDHKIASLGVMHLCNAEILDIVWSFTGNGSVELFEALLEEFLSRDMTSMNSHPIAEFVWSFAKKEQEADELFDKVEAEVISRDMMDLNKTDFVKILWAFGKAEKGSKEFFQSLDHKIASMGVRHLCNAEILDIVWSFSKRHFSGAIFDVVKDELFQRGVQTLHTHELVLILLSFFSAQRHDDKLISEIEDVLCIRSVKHIASAQLCQLAWCLARTEKSDSGLFDSIEAVVSQRGISVFYKEEKLLLLQGFVEANKGSKKFYQLLCSSLLANKLSDFSERDIQQFAWCLSHVDIETGAIFDTLEKEIFNNEKYQFTEKQLISIKRSFEKVGKGTKELFEFEL